MAADLGTFEGRDVVRTTIAVTNAGDGLSRALGIEPELFHLGETVHVVMECTVAKVRHEDVKGTEVVERVHVLRAGTATIVDGASVADVLDAQRVKNEAAARAAKGEMTLPVDEEQLRGDHNLGLHRAELVDECPLCMEEADLAEQEREE